MFQGNHKKYRSTKDIYLVVGKTLTDKLNWKAGMVYQSYYWTTRLWGTELYLPTEQGDSSAVDEAFLLEEGFIEWHE